MDKKISISTTNTAKRIRKHKSKKTITNANADVDADAELALALSASDDTNITITAEMENYEFIRQQQEEADAEYARQLAQEFELANTPANPAASDAASAMAASAMAPSDYGVDVGNGDDDINAILEEIARMEAQESLKKNGHAYLGKANINNVLEDESREEARIREKVKRDVELREWREERARQDAEFAAMQEYDRLQEQKDKAIETSISESASTPISKPEEQAEPKPEPEPAHLNNEDLRRARIAYFTNASKLQKS